MDQNMWITIPAELASAFHGVKFLKLNQTKVWVQISDYGVWKWFNWSLNKLLGLQNCFKKEYTKKPTTQVSHTHKTSVKWLGRVGMRSKCIKLTFLV